jgi:hypothetical protein
MCLCMLLARLLLQTTYASAAPWCLHAVALLQLLYNAPTMTSPLAVFNVLLCVQRTLWTPPSVLEQRLCAGRAYCLALL